MKTVDEVMELADNYATAVSQHGEAHDHVARDALRTEIEELHRDAARYRWLHYNGLKLSFSHELIGLLLSNKTELDAAMEAK